MEFLKWDDKYSVKVGMIDDQHKQLFQIINEFYNNTDKKASNEEIGVVLNKLYQYAIMHFNTEEFYLRQYGLNLFDEHKREHDAFVKEVQNMVEKHREGKLVMSFTVMNFIKKWVTNHVLGTDMKYTVIFNKNGIK